MRFLILKTSSIGDVAQVLELPQFLKFHFPNAQIDWVCEVPSSALLQAHPNVDRVLEIDSKKWRKNPLVHRKEITAFVKDLRKQNYTALFDLQGNCKSALLVAFAKAQKKVGFCLSQVAEKPNWFFTNVHINTKEIKNASQKYLQLLEGFFGLKGYQKAPLELRLKKEEKEGLAELFSLGKRPIIMVCPHSRWPNKEWGQTAWIELLLSIKKEMNPSFLFVYQGEKEQEIAHLFEEKVGGRVIGQMSLPLWQNVMGLCDLVFCVDSAALHLCATTKTPTFSLFGPSSAESYRPAGKHHQSFVGPCPFSLFFEKRCPKLRTCSSGACLKEVDPKQVFSQFIQFWESLNKDTQVLR